MQPGTGLQRQPLGAALPNSTVSITGKVIEAQITATNGPAARLEPLWMACASNSFPVPVSVRISRGKSRAMARRMAGTSASICASLVCGYFRPFTGCGAVAT